MRYLNDLSGKRFAIAGAIDGFPRMLGPGLEAHLLGRGALLVDAKAQLDYAVVGEGRAKGRAEALRNWERRIEKGELLHKLDQQALFHLLRPDLSARGVMFLGGFEKLRDELRDAGLEALGARAVSDLDQADLAIAGPRRFAGRAELLRSIEARRAAGSSIELHDEDAYLELIALAAPAQVGDFGTFVLALRRTADTRRVDKALDMLRREALEVYMEVGADKVSGIVQSQSSSGVYACCLRHDGRFSCVDDALHPCMGQQGNGPCKHTLVLLLGMVKGAHVPAHDAQAWLTLARKMTPTADEPGVAEALLRYRGVRAGELEWRPEQLMPEDFYAY